MEYTNVVLVWQAYTCQGLTHVPPKSDNKFASYQPEQLRTGTKLNDLNRNKPDTDGHNQKRHHAMTQEEV